jgi:hypothetical protein
MSPLPLRQVPRRSTLATVRPVGQLWIAVEVATVAGFAVLQWVGLQRA